MKYGFNKNDTINLLQDFFDRLRSRTIGFANARHLPQAILDLQNHPEPPSKNMVVSFKCDDTWFYIIYTNYKIELSDSFDDGHETYTRFCFRYELSGYTDLRGDLNEFRSILFNCLSKVAVTEIGFSDEE